MAPRKRPWFRFYVEALWDRKLRKLSPAHRWLWVAVLGCARSSPVPGLLLLVEGSEPMDLDDLADAAALKLGEVRSGVKLFENARMIDRDPETNAYRVVRWKERQYESDARPKPAGKDRRKSDDTATTRPRNDAETSGDSAPPENRRQKTEDRTLSSSSSEPSLNGHEIDDDDEAAALFPERSPSHVAAMLRSFRLRQQGFGTPVNDLVAWGTVVLDDMERAEAKANGSTGPVRAVIDGETWERDSDGDWNVVPG